MSLPDTFLTFETVGSFGGATAATLIVTNGIRRAFGWTAGWIGLVIAQIIVLGGTFFVADFSGKLLFIGIINGFLVFLSSAGANEGVVSARGFQPQSASKRRPFFQSWFWQRSQ
jgi:hypothetical protein